MASSQFNLGILRVKTILDYPGHIHYGSEGVITGTVVLRFHPKIRSHKVELAGPLELAVIFQGTIKTFHQKQYFPETLKLFSQTATLHNGSFRADPEKDYKFPFALAFPETADPRETVSIAMRPDADGSLQYRRRVTSVIVEDLPPTLTSNVSKRFSGVPKHIFVGQQISFDLYINERRDGTTDLATPEVKLDSCTVMLIAHTSSKDTAIGKTSLNHEVVLSDRHVAVTPSGPFANGHEHRKQIKAVPLGRIPSSFTHARIQRSYTLRIAIQLLVAEQVVSRKRDFKVEVHPPFALDDGPTYEAAVDLATANEVADNEPPPAYEEAIADSRNAQDMPPSWEEAQTGTLVQSSRDCP